MLKDKEYEYYAFISYKREDEKWAKWLQKKLESYGFPSSLRKQYPFLPSKIRPIFRDQTDLSGSFLKVEIEKALSHSKFLIVICSPRSAKSHWISLEIKYFLHNVTEECIIPLIVEGTPYSGNDEECFPEDLRNLKGDKEIIGININEDGEDPAILKVIARMFGLRFDALWQRFEKDRKNRQRYFFGIAVLMASLAMTSGIFYLKSKRAYKELNKINIELLAASERLKQDSILTNRHLLRIQNDSIRLVQQKDSLQNTLYTLECAKQQIIHEQRENRNKKDLMEKTKAEIISYYASDTTNTKWRNLYVGIGGTETELEYKKDQLRRKDAQREENSSAELINKTSVFGLQ